MTYSLEEIKKAAYNWTEPKGMTRDERSLWMGLGYCYEWYRAHPEDKEACDELSRKYIRFYWKGDEHGRAGT